MGSYIQTSPCLDSLQDKIYCKLSKARMKIWAIKARWIKACMCCKQQEKSLNCHYCFLLAVRLCCLWLKQCLLHNIAENITKRVQKQENKEEKLLWAWCAKSTQTMEDLKVKVNTQSPVPTSSLYCEKIYGWMKLYIFVRSSLCVFLARHPNIFFRFFVHVYIPLGRYFIIMCVRLNEWLHRILQSVCLHMMRPGIGPNASCI